MLHDTGVVSMSSSLVLGGMGGTSAPSVSGMDMTTLSDLCFVPWNIDMMVDCRCLLLTCLMVLTPTTMAGVQLCSCNFGTSLWCSIHKGNHFVCL